MKHYFISYASPRGFGRTGISVPEGADLELAKATNEEWICILYFTETSREIVAGLQTQEDYTAVWTSGPPPKDQENHPE
jgi:hypothetical protein